MSLLPESFNKAAATAEERLARLKEIFASIPEGRELLELAEESGCAISFHDHLPGDIAGKMSFMDHALYLDPRAGDAVLLHVLAHELRHLWQACTVDFSGSGVLSGAPAFVFKRVTEGDAHAFAMSFSEKLQEKTGIDIPHHDFSGHAPSAKVDMRETFLNFQKTPHARAYDLGIIDTLKSMQSEIDGGKITRPALAALFRDCADAPPACDPGLADITIEGLAFSADGVKYIDFKSVEELTASILAHVPADTLRQAQKLAAGIKRSAGVAAGLAP